MTAYFWFMVLSPAQRLLGLTSELLWAHHLRDVRELSRRWVSRRACSVDDCLSFARAANRPPQPAALNREPSPVSIIVKMTSRMDFGGNCIAGCRQLKVVPY